MTDELETKLAFARSRSNAGLGWLPIETAPKNGTEIIGCTAGSGDVEFYRFYDGMWTTRGDYFHPQLDLTHWMPIPDAPNVL